MAATCRLACAALFTQVFHQQLHTARALVADAGTYVGHTLATFAVHMTVFPTKW